MNNNNKTSNCLILRLKFIHIRPTHDYPTDFSLDIVNIYKFANLQTLYIQIDYFIIT